MKKTIQKKLLILTLGSFLGGTTIGCYGNYELLKKLHTWNGSIGEPFVNSVVMWAMIIIPVYPLSGLVDFWILNTIEFWSGENPAAMGPKDLEKKIVEKNGQQIEITATQNRFDFKNLDSEERASLVYEPSQKSWFVESNGDTINVANEKGNGLVELVKPNGNTLVFNTKTGRLN